MSTEVARYQVVLFGISAGRYLGVRKHNYNTRRDAISSASVLVSSRIWIGYLIIENSWRVTDSYRGEYVDFVDGKVVASNLFKNTLIKHEKTTT